MKGTITMASDTSATMTNKTAIITGGSRGIGRNTAVSVARRGVDIIFT
jgi:NAD(P)-dependent dehydrogenase (short-subunit alcohol dehydrogenase family)